ncbi:MAG: ABC transporter ATP-binding protein, partial [Acidimicrobiia bacterium]
MAIGGGFGGGFGGGLARGLGGGPMESQRQAARAGLPFGGIPSELQDGVEALLAREPARAEPDDVVFAHRSRERPGVSLRRLLADRRGQVLATALLVLIETASLQSAPLLIQIGIDHGIVDRNRGALLAAGIGAIAAVLVTGVASAGRVATAGRMAAGVMRDLRTRVFGHLQRLSLDFYVNEKAGVIMSRMTSDIEQLQQLLQESLVQFAVQGLTVIVVTVVLFSYNAELAMITVLLVVPILTALSLWFRSASERGYERVRDGIAGVLSDLSESLAGVRLITAFNRQLHNTVQHRNVVGTYKDANQYTAKVNAVYGSTSDAIGLLGQAALLLIGGRMVLRDELTVGQLAAFILYLGAFFQPIQQLVQLYNQYQAGRAAVVKLDGLLRTEPGVPEAAGAVPLPPITGELTLEGVSFGYEPGEPVVHDLDLHIEAGETIALVGPTGAGKSTVAKLVTRLYDPTAGRVLLDGHDLRTVTIESLRRQLGVVPQEPFLFGGTVRDNICFARPTATDGELWETVRRVGLTDLVERLPQGLDTPVHERGVSLSSGERQLLALARAFLAHPRVLVLDEATSNLDLESETKVEAALDSLLEGRTAILVAHRLSTARRADRIVVMDGGRIVEVDTHDGLVANGGRYAEMFAAWMSHAD